MFINNLNFLNFPFLGRGGGKTKNSVQGPGSYTCKWFMDPVQNGWGGGGMPGTFLDRLEELFLVVHNHLNQACMGNITSDK